LLLMLLAWPAKATPAPQPERALQHARVLASEIGPRPAGSEPVRRATEYVAEAFGRIGLEVERIPIGHQEVPAIYVMDDEVMSARTIDLEDETLVVRIPATSGRAGRAIVVMAHVDTVEGTPGAIDNAAAVGVLVELARSLSETQSRPHDVVLAATACEEHGLVGARTLAARLGVDGVAVAISLDLIGGTGPLTLNGLSSNLGDVWLDRIARAATNAGVAIEAPLTHQVVSRLLPQIERSDHGPFTALGLPAFHLYNRGPRRIDLHYHKPGDTFDHIDARSVQATLGMLEAFVLDETALPTAPGEPATWLPIGNTTVVRDSVLFVIELLVLAWCVLGMHRASKTGAGLRDRLRSGVVVWGLAIGVWGLAIAIESIATGDHPMPWIHAPGPSIVATLVLGGGLLTTASPWLRAAPHLPASAGATTIAIAALPGAILLWFDIVALAWIPLAQAGVLAMLAWAPRVRTRAMLLGVAMLPGWACVDPDLLREAAFHHFLPRVPLATILLVAFLAPSIAALRLLSQLRIDTRTRWVIAAIALGGWIAIAVGSSAFGRQCAAERFAEIGLACEVDAQG
jgi:aminopeptidase YwaD